MVGIEIEKPYMWDGKPRLGPDAGLPPLTESAPAVERIGKTYPQVYSQEEHDWLPIYILGIDQMLTHMWR